VIHASGQQSAYEAWQGLLNKKELTDYFKGTFESLGIVVDQTGERITVLNKGDHFEIEKGADSAKTDYFMHIKPENVQNLKKYADDNVIDEKESYRIQSVLFTPLTQSGLNQPVLKKKVFLKKAKIEQHIHVYLDSPDGQGSVSQTIVFANDQWIIVPGIYGKAQRVFHLTPQQALDYQRELFAAQKADNLKTWKAFLGWYNKWKDTVSKPG
jgi:hypothetical protein